MHVQLTVRNAGAILALLFAACLIPAVAMGAGRERAVVPAELSGLRGGPTGAYDIAAAPDLTAWAGFRGGPTGVYDAALRAT